MATKKDKRKAKKAKKRQERIRQEKHARSVGGGYGLAAPDPLDRLVGPDHGWDGDPWDDEEAEDLPAGVDFTLERIQRTLAWSLARRSFADQAAVNRFVAEEINSDAWKKPHGDMLAASTEERAQEIAFLAMEVSDEDDAIDLARQALELDADCLDAARIVTEFDLPTDQRLRHLTDMLKRYGQRPEVAKAIADRDGQTWPRVVSRPYLRTVMELIDLAAEEQDLDAAIGWTEDLRSRAAAQYEPWRERHLGWLLARGRHDEAQALLDRHPDDHQSVWLWGRALARFMAGDLPGARIAVDEARQTNGEEFEAMVLDGPEEPLYDEEVVLLDTIGRAWKEHDAALTWLEEGCCLTTPGQRSQAKQAYRPPVAGLLALGEPKAEREALAQLLPQTGITAADVPELLRMADDQALSELFPDDPAVYAPVHALRALGRLHPPEAVPALMGMLPRRMHDDWMRGSLTAAFGSIGQPAIAPLRNLVTDQSRRPVERGFAVEALVAMAERQPDLHDEVLGILIHAMRGYRGQPQTLNGHLAWGLACLHAVGSTDLVEEVYESGCIDRDVAGSWDDWLEHLERGDRPDVP